MSRSKLLLLTLGISSAIHLALATAYLWLQQSPGAPSAHAVVEINLQQIAPAQTTTPPVQQADPIPDEKVLSTLQTTDQPPVLADADTPPKPQPAESIEQETEAEAEPRIQEPQSKESLAAEPISDAAPSALQAARSGQQKAKHSAALEAEKQNYLGLVAEHINSYKYYPRSAIRRGTEGEVEVSFDLQVDGRIENLRTRGEHSVLLSASQRSIEQALPMPQRTENLLALGAIHIEFSMKYFLHEQ
ncbi:MAG TPA: energy transducer TonB [Gammaproteobacteria bacterium]